MNNYSIEIDPSNATVSDLIYEFTKRVHLPKAKSLGLLYQNDDGVWVNWDDDNVLRHHLREAVTHNAGNLVVRIEAVQKGRFSDYKDLTDVLKSFNTTSLGSLPIMDLSITPLVLTDVQSKRIDTCVGNIKDKLHRFIRGVTNEAVAREFISEVLLAAVALSDTFLDAEYSITGDENQGRVDYSIFKDEELLCVAEAKESAVSEGLAMNIMQCQGALQEAEGQRKRKHSNGEKFNYIYGITTTGSVWKYIMLTSDNQLYVGVPDRIPLDREFLGKGDQENELARAVKDTVTRVAWMLRNRADAKTTSKRQCVQGLIQKPVSSK